METSGPEDEVLKLMPALNIDLVVLERGLNILVDCVSEVTGQELSLVLGDSSKANA